MELTEDEHHLVSIIIPTHRRNKALKRCLESVARQEYDPVEVIVVDGSITDDAAPIAEQYDAVYVSQDSPDGAMAARLLGIEAASGSLVHFLDDDDELLQGAIAQKVDVFTTNDHVGVVYSGVRLNSGHSVYGGINRESHDVTPDDDGRGDVLELALSFQLVPCSNSMLLIEASLLEPLVKQFEPSYDDLWLVVELAKLTRFEFVNDILVLRYDSDESVGMSYDAVEEQWLVLEENANLYEQFPPEVRRHALADTYQLSGVVRLKKETLSFGATISFAKAFYHKPGFSMMYLGMCLASIFGLQVWELMARVFVDISLRDGHQGNL